MRYLRWIHVEDYAITHEAYIEDESTNIIDDEFIGPKNPIIIIEDESTDVIEDESIDPKKIIPVLTILDESIDPETHRVILYKWTNYLPKKTNPVIRRS